TSDWYLPSAFCAAIGVPMSTLLVAAKAVGASTSDSAAAQAKTVSLLTFCSFRLDSADPTLRQRADANRHVIERPPSPASRGARGTRTCTSRAPRRSPSP